MEETRLTTKTKGNNGLNGLGNSAYTIPEAATVLRMSEKSVRRQIDRGHLRRCIKFGRVLIPRKDVDNFFERNSEYAFSRS